MILIILEKEKKKKRKKEKAKKSQKRKTDNIARKEGNRIKKESNWPKISKFNEINCNQWYSHHFMVHIQTIQKYKNIS